MLALSVLSIAAVAVAAPIRFTTVLVAQNLTYTNATQAGEAQWYTQNGNKGACGEFSRDLDMVVGLGLDFYNNTGVKSEYCGSYITVTNPLNNETVTARVADASGSGNLSMSVASWRAIKGDETKMQNVTWVFSNNTEIAAAVAYARSMVTIVEPAADVSSAQAFPAAPSSTYVAPLSTYVAPSSTYVAPSTTEAAPSSTYTPPSSTYQAPAPTSTYVAPSSTYVAPSSTYVAPPSTYQAPQPTQAPSNQFSGDATYYYQNGNPGHCGNYNSDSAYIVALDSAMYAGGSNCGRQVRITRTSTGKTITATVADSCPTCNSGTSLDLSYAAFVALADTSVGLFPMTWSWV